ncbi:hypothetical protein J6590_069372, partial [Homalodisca vitripennis]
MLLVTLCVRNAFNLVGWSDMLNAMWNTFIIPAYPLWLIKNYLRFRLRIYGCNLRHRAGLDP